MPATAAPAERRHRARERRRADGAAPAAAAPARRPRRGAAAAPACPGPGVAERRTLMLVTFLLLVYGLVMAYSASAAQAYFQYDSSFYFFKRQVVWVVLGGGAMWVLSRVDYAWCRKAAVPLAGLVLAGLVAVLVPGVGSVINGARRWIYRRRPGHPAQRVRQAGRRRARRDAHRARGRGRSRRRGASCRLAVIGIVPAGGARSCSSRTSAPRSCWWWRWWPCSSRPARRCATCSAWPSPASLAVLALIVVEPYRLERLVTFLDPWKDPQGSGFQATQSLISIASGRVFGVGLGNSVQKFGFLPEQRHRHDHRHHRRGARARSASLVLLALYAALAWACFRIALNCRDLFGKLLATGITAIIIGQACINVGAALGLLPLTGVPLPLVSLGGTSLLVVLAGLGILLNIATNRRSYIAVSAQRRDRAAGGGGDRRSPAAGARRRG